MIHSTSNTTIDIKQEGITLEENTRHVTLENRKTFHLHEYHSHNDDDDNNDDDDGRGRIQDSTTIITLTPHLIHIYKSALLQGMAIGFFFTWILTVAFVTLVVSDDATLFPSAEYNYYQGKGMYIFTLWSSAIETLILLLLFLGCTYVYRTKCIVQSRGMDYPFVGPVFLVGAWVRFLLFLIYISIYQGIFLEDSYRYIL